MANHVKARRKQLRLTQQAVADASGTTKATIMKLERGDMQLTQNWLQRLAEPLQCEPADLILPDWPQQIPIVGEVDGKGEVELFLPFLFRNDDIDESVYWQEMEKAPRLPNGNYAGAKALKVVDDSFNSLLSVGSLIYFCQMCYEDLTPCMRRLTVCQTIDGSVYVTRLQRGYETDTYNLTRVNSAMIESQQLRWCAPVVFMKTVR